jgi:hypothetical protein
MPDLAVVGDHRQVRQRVFSGCYSSWPEPDSV